MAWIFFLIAKRYNCNNDSGKNNFILVNSNISFVLSGIDSNNKTSKYISGLNESNKNKHGLYNYCSKVVILKKRNLLSIDNDNDRCSNLENHDFMAEKNDNFMFEDYNKLFKFAVLLSLLIVILISSNLSSYASKIIDMIIKKDVFNNVNAKWSL